MPDAPLIILSGPSGSGKSTLIARVLERTTRPLRLSVSATTRQPRPGEEDGKHYHFWDTDRFEEAIDAHEFLEWAKVHGNYYGTLASEVDPHLERGTGVILDIDVQGAEAVRAARPEHLSIFVEVPEGLLETRLRARGTESEASILRRLARAAEERKQAGQYHVRLVNDDLEATITQLHRVIEDRFLRS